MNIGIEELKTDDPQLFTCPLCLGSHRVMDLEIFEGPKEVDCPLCEERGEVFISINENQGDVLQSMLDDHYDYSAV